MESIGKAELEKVISESFKNMAGLKVAQDGKTIYEKYYNGCDVSSRIHIASATKSVISALFGIAIEDGSIHSLDQKVLEFFPEYEVPKGENIVQQVTLRDMLTMTAPYKCDDEPYDVFGTDNWLKGGLDILGGSEKPGRFHYAAMVGSHILSGVLMRATGQSVRKFANQRLFAPLGFQVDEDVVLQSEEDHMKFVMEQSRQGWVIDPMGIHTAGWGLTLAPSEMIRLGELYLNNGVWNRQQLVPRQWVQESTKEYVNAGDMGYGYLWWIIDDSKHIYAALGAGGNIIYVNAERRLVVAITSLFIPQQLDWTGFIRDYIEPLVD